MIHIQLNDDYDSVTYHYGVLNDRYNFKVIVIYDSVKSKYEIKDVIFDRVKWRTEPEPDIDWKDAKKKIKDFTRKWLFDKPEI